MATLTGTPAALDPLLIAEDANAYVPPWPIEIHEDLGDVVLHHGRTSHHGDGGAFRVRFETPATDRRVEDVRAWMAERGREAFTWWVGTSTTPSDLMSRLLRRGAVLE